MRCWRATHGKCLNDSIVNKHEVYSFCDSERINEETPCERLMLFHPNKIQKYLHLLFLT